MVEKATILNKVVELALLSGLLYGVYNSVVKLRKNNTGTLVAIQSF